MRKLITEGMLDLFAYKEVKAGGRSRNIMPVCGEENQFIKGRRNSLTSGIIK